MVTAVRACVDNQRPPVDTGSRRVHRQTVQQLGHYLKKHKYDYYMNLACFPHQQPAYTTYTHGTQEHVVI